MSDVGVGDSEVAALTVTPADDDTVAVLTVTAPDGTETVPDVTGGALTEVPDEDYETQQWTSDDPVLYDQPGRWVLHWDVTGTGASAEDQEVYVVASPVAGLASWVPGRSRVANYVPGRTTVVVGAGRTPQDTFSSSTRPTGVQVDRLIADAVGWVTLATGEVDESLHETAAMCASLYAASSVELSYPDRSTEVKDSARQIAEDLLRRATMMRDDLVRANVAAGSSPVPGGSVVLPYWQFPDPPLHADLDL